MNNMHEDPDVSLERAQQSRDIEVGLEARIREFETDKFSREIENGGWRGIITALEAQLAEARAEQLRRSQCLPLSGPMTENEFRLLFSESVCESDFPLVDDDGEFTTEAIDALTNIAEGTAERLFAERDESITRAEQAEAQEAALRDTLTKVEAYMASEEGPICRLWENCDIGNYDDCQTDWEQTLFDVRDWKNGCVPAASLGGGTEWPEVLLYREILAALALPSKPETASL